MENWHIYLMFTDNLVVVVTGVSKGITVLISVRDEVRDGLKDLKVAVGTSDPPNGLLGDVRALKHDARTMRDWSIEASSVLEIRRPGGRS